ncbi:aminoglycoside phosphotransferase family protein [Desulfofustis limnaeus]|uniref:CHK kinase-like domain-containing protein n=1 Tax=Desulfofustis limnaeus TaxID=2740163 RepID=A0ABM7W7I6_9BACT|nr:phosphotransferase [Desulfofustis limnaeus]BDD86836.1 hypothetical protein DPPLL_12010 [Desulfofustis limnaeus]
MTLSADLTDTIARLLAPLIPGGQQPVLQPLLGDGSARRFFRVFAGGRPLCLAALPAGGSQRELAEAASWLAIVRHLHQAGAPVPQVLGADLSIGLLLFEDFGDCRLHDLLHRDRPRGLALYPEIVRRLAQMQVRGVEGFQTDWCYDAPCYDQAVMVERESLYFLSAFWVDTLFAEEVAGLREEFERLAATAAATCQPLFMHRDFQSRNIMVGEDRLGFIDFQAGRLGPPAYDVASLLIDPYASLSDRQQHQVFALYLEEMGRLGGVDLAALQASYPYLAVQRNLQIIGAFAYLSGRRGKGFFRGFILPSLIMLQNRLADPLFTDLPVLRQTVATSITTYRRMI